MSDLPTVHVYEPKYEQRIFGHTWLAQCGDAIAFGDSQHTAFWALITKLRRRATANADSP